MGSSDDGGSFSPSVQPPRISVLVQRSQEVVEQLVVHRSGFKDLAETTDRTLALCLSFMNSRLQCSVKEDYMLVDASKSDTNVSEATAVVHNLACLSIAACCSVQFAPLTTTILKKTIDAFPIAFELPLEASGSLELKRVKDIRTLLLTQYMVQVFARALIDAEHHKVSGELLHYRDVWNRHPELVTRILFAVNVTRRFLKLAEHRRSVKSPQSDKNLLEVLARAFPWAELANRLKDYISHQYQIIKKRLEYERILSSAYMRPIHNAGRTRSGRIIKRRSSTSSQGSVGPQTTDYSSPTQTSLPERKWRFKPRRKESERDPESPSLRKSHEQHMSQPSPVAKKSYKIPRSSPEVHEDIQIESSLPASSVLSGPSSPPLTFPSDLRHADPSSEIFTASPRRVSAEPSKSQLVAASATPEKKLASQEAEDFMQLDEREVEALAASENEGQAQEIVAIEQDESLRRGDEMIIDSDLQPLRKKHEEAERLDSEANDRAPRQEPEQTTDQEIPDLQQLSGEVTGVPEVGSRSPEGTRESHERYAMQLWRNKILESKRQYMLSCRHTLSPIGLPDIGSIIQDRLRPPTVSAESLKEMSMHLATSNYSTNHETGNKRKRSATREAPNAQRQVYSPPHKRPSRSRGPPTRFDEIQPIAYSRDLQDSHADSNITAAPTLQGESPEEHAGSQPQVSQSAENISEVEPLPKNSQSATSHDGETSSAPVLATPLPSVSLATAEAIKRSMNGIDFAKAWSVLVTQGPGLPSDMSPRTYTQSERHTYPVDGQSNSVSHQLRTGDRQTKTEKTNSIADFNPSSYSEKYEGSESRAQEEKKVETSKTVLRNVEPDVIADVAVEISVPLNQIKSSNVTEDAPVIKCRQIPATDDSISVTKRLSQRIPVANNGSSALMNRISSQGVELTSKDERETIKTSSTSIENRTDEHVTSAVQPISKEPAQATSIGSSASRPIEISDSPSPERGTEEAGTVLDSSFSTSSKLVYKSTSQSNETMISEIADTQMGSTPIFLRSEDSSDGPVSSDADLRSEDFEMSQLEELARKNLESNSSII